LSISDPLHLSDTGNYLRQTQKDNLGAYFYYQIIGCAGVNDSLLSSYWKTFKNNLGLKALKRLSNDTKLDSWVSAKINVNIYKKVLTP